MSIARLCTGFAIVNMLPSKEDEIVTIASVRLGMRSGIGMLLILAIVGW